MYLYMNNCKPGLYISIWYLCISNMVFCSICFLTGVFQQFILYAEAKILINNITEKICWCPIKSLCIVTTMAVSSQTIFTDIQSNSSPVSKFITYFLCGMSSVLVKKFRHFKKETMHSLFGFSHCYSASSPLSSRGISW